ncbi:hypothetical protein N0V91_004103 [Didymella pomorum]|uniref:Uncharacterized protein n=1 Tax=Didymella pomorum TaxID=749634 RepID=A0A9W8ZHD0_9PLEO|nr:hypothetical protein N0V91_004103 [Didymella pomorum]
MPEPVQTEYPLTQDSYIAAFDDEKLFEEAKEGYMKNGMTEEEADREVRDAAAVLKKNELYDKAILDPADPKDHQLWRRDRMNISRSALLKVLEAYDIAPGTCSHIRGQEQIFGSRTTKNKTTNEVTAIEFWYAIRARAYFRAIDKDADVKMTIITKHDVATKSTVVLLKYRSFNDLANKLKSDLVSKLEELVRRPNTQDIAANPFAVSMLHFSCTAQWYRRAARDPRDSVRIEEEKAHVLSKQQKNELKAINVRRLHLTMRNLDQDKLQLTQIIGTIRSLRKQHEWYQKFVLKMPAEEDRDWLYTRVDEELDRFEDQLKYLRASIEDVCGRAQRLLDLGILGTNLFSPENINPSGPGDSAVSPFRAASQWWILLITIFPLTFLTFLGWWIGRTRSEKRIRRSLEEEDKKVLKMQELKLIKTKSQGRNNSWTTFGSRIAGMNDTWFRRVRTIRMSWIRRHREEIDSEMDALPI